MNFILRNRVLILFTASALTLVIALFWPEAKKPGEMQKYYSIPQNQLESIAYSGQMTIADKKTARVEYVIQREENILKPKEPLYRIEIKSLSTTDSQAFKRVAELQAVRSFYASSMVRTMVQDWSEPDYFYILKHESERDAEYGLKDCANKLTLTFRARTKQFCVGTATQGDSRRYLLDVDADKVLITPDFTVRRLLNNIFAQRDQALYPHGPEGADLIEVNVQREVLEKFPLLKEKTSGRVKLRMLINDEGKTKINVWHVEGQLAIKPSHAAEFAQLFNALRVNAPFATSALGSEQSMAAAARIAGIDAQAVPGLTGAIKLRKTDKQDIQLAAFSFYPPGVKAKPQPAFQFEQQLVRPLDTLVVSHYNAGYLSADLYPRITGILTKFEIDLNEAKQKESAAKEANPSKK